MNKFLVTTSATKREVSDALNDRELNVEVTRQCEPSRLLEQRAVKACLLAHHILVGPEDRDTYAERQDLIEQLRAVRRLAQRREKK